MSDKLLRCKISNDEYQCGCRWDKAENVQEAFDLGVRGDILVLCDFHKTWNDHHFEKLSNDLK
jgi:hypothetical protein